MLNEIVEGGNWSPENASLRRNAAQGIIRLGLAESHQDAYVILARLLGYADGSGYTSQLRDEHKRVLQLLAGPHAYAVFKVLEFRHGPT